MVNPGESFSKTLRKRFLEEVKIKSKNNEEDEVKDKKFEDEVEEEKVTSFKDHLSLRVLKSKSELVRSTASMKSLISV